MSLEDYPMKRTMRGLATALAALSLASSALASPVCLQAYRIRNTTVVDSRTVLFHMNDGTVWRNTLQTPCPALRFRGFSYVLRGEDAVCDNQVPIRVIESGQVCMLGKFTPASG